MVKIENKKIGRGSLFAKLMEKLDKRVRDVVLTNWHDVIYINEAGKVEGFALACIHSQWLAISTLIEIAEALGAIETIGSQKLYEGTEWEVTVPKRIDFRDGNPPYEVGY